MVLKRWEDLPEKIKNEDVKRYYDILSKKRISLVIKRIFDLVLAIILLIILSPLFIIIAIAIKIDSKGPVMFRQTRVTQYGKKFRIFKFRTMITDAEKIGSQVTTKNDTRITRIGRVLRKYRLDEIPQLLNIIAGEMSFVGTRPEVPKYVERYTDEMLATLLLPAGVTSEASIQYKDEELLLTNASDIDEVYINRVLSGKMKYNLKSMEYFSLLNDIKTMFKTVIVFVQKKERANRAIARTETNKSEVRM
ncbi:MAG TPA: sugar transferase [Acetivibrio sp.]|nr:sugar transferase [Acetivibrio sp.]